MASGAVEAYGEEAVGMISSDESARDLTKLVCFIPFIIPSRRCNRQLTAT